MDQVLLRADEAAQALGIPRSTFYQMLSRGAVPCVRFGRRSVRVPADALKRWVEEQERAGVTAAK